MYIYVYAILIILFFFSVYVSHIISTHRLDPVVLLPFYSVLSPLPLGRGEVSKRPCGAEPPSMLNHSTALSP